MPGTIWRLTTPITVKNTTVEYLNIFRADMETYRPEGSKEAYFKRYYAACDASGKEILIDGEALSPILSDKIFATLTADEKSRHKDLLACGYAADALAGILPPGEAIDATED